MVERDSVKLNVKWIEFSASIFYPDLTYTYSDAIREYDMLAYLSVRDDSSILVLVGEDVGSDHESTKDIVDVALGSRSLFFTNSNKFANSLASGSPILGRRLYNRLIKEFMDTVSLGLKPRSAKDFNNVMVWLRRACTELANLVYIIQLYINRELAGKVLSDWAKYLQIKSTSRNTLPRGLEKLAFMCSEYYKSLLALALSVDHSSPAKLLEEVKQVTSKGVLQHHKLLDYLREKIRSRNWVLIVFPQYVRISDSKSTRLEYMAETVKNLVEKLCCKNKVVLVSNKAIGDFPKMVEELKNKLTSYSVNTVIYNAGEDRINQYVSDKVEVAVVLVLQDYGKKILLGVLKELKERCLDVIVVFIPETFYDIEDNARILDLEDFKVRRIVRSYYGFMSNRVEHLNLFRVLILEGEALEKILEETLI